MNQFLPYLTPPLVGAFIGYMTNYIAIRMLFRPLKPWRILGIRVPMTPGVIPAKRYDLAKNIGEMVGEHLLTSDDISHAIKDKSFQRELRQLIDNRIDEVLNKDLGPIASLVPMRFVSYFEVGVKVLRWRFLKHLHAHLDSESFAKNISATVGSHLDTYLSKELHACLPPESLEHFFVVLESTTSRFLGSPEVQDWIRNTIKQRIDQFIDDGGSLGDLLPESMVNPILERLEKETPHLLEKFATALKEPLFQEKITSTICQAISKFTASLGPLASLIGNFIPTDTINQKVRSFLSDKSSDISAWLFDSAVQQKTAALLREKALEFLSTPASELLSDVPPETVAETHSWLAEFVTETLKNPSTTKALIKLIKEALVPQNQRPLQEIFHDLLGEENLTNSKTWAADEVVNIIRSSKVKRMLDDTVTDLIEKKILAQPLGKLSDLLPKAVQEGIGDYLLQQVNKLLVREVPGLVDSLNIRTIVTKKVNSLDLLRLEGLLLSIMQEQFKYINLFGALLGFLIGIVNLLFIGTY